MKEKLVEFAQSMIDELCERDGVFATIERLYEFGFTKYEITHYLKFNPNDVEEALEEDEEFDEIEFFPGDDGDLAAEDYIEENHLKGAAYKYDEYRHGYVLYYED